MVSSPEMSGIPQSAPAGVFVSNNQTPVVVDQSAGVNTPVQTSASVVPTQPVSTKQGALDGVLQNIVRFFAKISGQPDPITGAKNSSATAQKTENIVGKVWNVANQVVEKASDAATKAVDAVNQATEKIQQVIPPQAAPQTPVESVPVAPVAPVAEVTPPTQPTV